MSTYRASSCFNLRTSSSLSLQHVLEEASECTLQVIDDNIMSQLVKIAVFSLLDPTHSLTNAWAQTADHMHKHSRNGITCVTLTWQVRLLSVVVQSTLVQISGISICTWASTACDGTWQVVRGSNIWCIHANTSLREHCVTKQDYLCWVVQLPEVIICVGWVLRM